jgi:hypothetical protein
MSEVLEIAKGGAAAWIGLAGAVLFLCLVLFRPVATKLVVNLRVPAKRAARVVDVSLLLVAAVTMASLGLAFLGAEDARVQEARQREADAFIAALTEQRENLRNCIAQEEAKASPPQSFEVPGLVRCPGGGCALQSASCNRREAWVSYATPEDYFIETSELVEDSMNEGHLGDLEVYARDGEGRAIAVRALLWCDPSDEAGASSAWAYATLRGTIRASGVASSQEDIAAKCLVKFPEPEMTAN